VTAPGSANTPEVTVAESSGSDADDHGRPYNDAVDGPLGGGRLVAVDDRYVVVAQLPDIQMRRAVSYGPNITKQLARDLLAPPVQEGDFVFGIHDIGTKGNRLAILDSWVGSEGARGVPNEAEILSQARDILASMDDEDYKKNVKENPDDRLLEFGRSLFSRPWTEVWDEEL
jgi:hypothetical protein